MEVWTADDVRYYRLDGKFLYEDYEKNRDEGGPVAHYRAGQEWRSWGRGAFHTIQEQSNRNAGYKVCEKSY